LPFEVTIMSLTTTTLLRPVGPVELALVVAADYRRFPPRLAHQPIFYPVCNATYAIEIASEWNAIHDGGGYVLRFDVRSDHLARYTKQVVGSRHHEEYWIPADELEAFNDAIVGPITLLHAFHARTLASAS
jgi:hypothetical protein